MFDSIGSVVETAQTYQQLSIQIQTQIKDKYNLSPVQMITFGFICPDHEFQARMTTFMYQQL